MVNRDRLIVVDMVNHDEIVDDFIQRLIEYGMERERSAHIYHADSEHTNDLPSLRHLGPTIGPVGGKATLATKRRAQRLARKITRSRRK